MLSQKIGFIGAGQMAKAFGISLVKRGIVKGEDVNVSCPEEHLLSSWKDVGCKTSLRNEDVLGNSNTIFWAVKPQIFHSALKSTNCEGLSSNDKFHVSLMAGIELINFEEGLSSHLKISNVKSARVMPNIAMKVASGCSVFTMGKNGTEENKKELQKLLSSVGLCFEVPEPQINAYCGLFSSGIGFMFPIIEGLSDGAVQMGIPRDLSIQIAAQVLKGAGELILADKNSHPGVLKDSVCSPAGTTIAGIAQIEKHGVRNALIQAIEAATIRGVELGKKK